MDYVQATLAYPGHKRKIVELLFAAIARAIPRSDWQTHTFHDPMCGSGVIPLAAKAAGFKTAASDISPVGMLGARALVANDHVKASRFLVARMADAASTGGSEAWADALFDLAHTLEGVAADVARLIASKLLLSATPFSRAPLNSKTGESTASLALRSLYKAPPGQHSLSRVATKVNRGIFPGAGSAVRGDFRDTVPAVGADVLYLDPPYAGTAGYGRAYARLNTLLDAEFDVSSPDDFPNIQTLLDVARATPVLALSFGVSDMPSGELKEVIARQRNIRFYDEFYRTYMPALGQKKSKEAFVVATLD